MALANKPYTGDGANAGPYTFPFSYLEDSHIHCYLDGVETTAFTLAVGSVTFDAAPGNGVAISIKRETPTTARLVDFVGGDTMIEATMDRDSDQIFFALQERIDEFTTALLVGTDDKIDASSKVIKNLADGAATTDAINKSQLDAAVLAAGNVPVPVDPTDDDKVLTASGGSHSWAAPAASAPAIADITDAGVVGAAILADTTAAAVRAEIAAQQDVVTTEGDTILGNGSGAAARLAIGANDTYLKSNGTTATWASITAGGGNFTMQVFTASGTWNKPTDLVAAEVFVVGAGGGGGASTTTNDRAGGGGGGGGLAWKRIAAGTLGATETVTIGAAGAAGSGSGAGSAGGNTTFGAHATGNGGSGGPTGAAYSTGGAGGTGASGDINLTGGQGANSSNDLSLTTSIALAELAGGYARGGEAPMGFSTRGRQTIHRNNIPVAPIGFGGGGDGNIRVTSGSTAIAGGAGVIIVKEYY